MHAKPLNLSTLNSVNLSTLNSVKIAIFSSGRLSLVSPKLQQASAYYLVQEEISLTFSTETAEKIILPQICLGQQFCSVLPMLKQ